ncbi:MAG: thiolase family protein [Acidimicrobiia bacterium]|nr:thiolase family protein [Acidimicrobiia bacterium]
MARVAVAGVAATRQARSLDGNSVQICLEAARAALDDAGLSLDDVDGISARWPGPGGTVFHPGSVDWSALLGKGFDWVGDTYPQGAPGLLDAAGAILAGQCSTVLVFGGRAGESGVGASGGQAVASYTRPDNEFTACWGSLTAAQFALVAQVYVHRFAPDPERMALVPATIRNAGSANPAAVMYGRGPYRPADVLASPPVAEPFRLLDLCLATEGAAAMVVTSLERARDCPSAPVVVLGGGSEWYRQQYVDPPRYDDVARVGSGAYRRSFGMAGLAPEDVDVFELYDINTFEVIRQFETLGFCAEGEGVDYLAEAGIGLDGRHPTNTDGGLLAYSHVGWGGPTLKIVEAVRQIRGTAGPSQVPGTEVALVTGAGSGAQYHNAVLLGSDR